MITKVTAVCSVILCVASLCRGAEPTNNSSGVFELNQSPSDSNKYVFKVDNLQNPSGISTYTSPDGSQFKFKFDTKINVTLNAGTDGTSAPVSVQVDSGNSNNISTSVIRGSSFITPAVRHVIVSQFDTLSLDERIKNCGRKQLEFNPLITNAQKTQPGDWPWHAAIYKTRSVTSANQNYICGGTLISKRIVITAGHCVAENGIKIIPERLFVVLGKYNIVGGDVAPQEKEVYEIILREGFSVRTLKNDIAILKLASEVGFGDYVQPICMWDRSKTEKSLIFGKFGTVVGWGITETGVLSTKLGRAVMPVASDFDCLQSFPAFYERFLNSKTYCAGFRNGTSVCNGDSGGGMYFPEDTPDGGTVWTLRGLVSVSVSRRNTKMCDANNYAVFTDITKHFEWIDANE